MPHHDRLTCPFCGRGTLVNIAFDEPARSSGDEPRQLADSLEVVTFSCGHRELGPSLATADPEGLDVERRRSEDTVEPSLPDDA
jgi:hypothetical protein